MQAWWEIKDRGIMGSAADEVKTITILGRTLAWTDDGLEMWADDKHRERMMETMGLEEHSTSVDHPVGDDETEGGEVEVERPTEFRGAAARLNYLALDRSDIQFGTKTICSGMANPTETGWA